MNQCVFMGRLTADPELRHTTAGVMVCSFALAVERDYTDSNGKRQADFVNFQAWRGTAEFICKYFAKGNLIAVVGSLQTRKYEDKQGNARTAYEVVVDTVSFTGDRREDAPRSAQQSGAIALPPAPMGEAVPQQQSFAPGGRTVGDALFSGNADDFAVIDDSEDLPF